MSLITREWSGVFSKTRALLSRDRTTVVRVVVSLLVLLTLLGASQVTPAPEGFAAENAQVTSVMTEAMRVPSSGDPDQDFASMMIAHHEGAIAMSRVELRYGRNPMLRTMAQHIVDTQGHEIDAMRRAKAR